VKAGDIVKVKVLEVDVARKRIALTRRLDDAAPAPAPRDAGSMASAGRRDDRRDAQSRGNQRAASAPPPANNALAAAFARARKD